MTDQNTAAHNGPGLNTKGSSTYIPLFLTLVWERGLTTASKPFLVWCMRNFTAVVERDPETGLFVGYIPFWAGAHSQGATLDELRENLREVVTMLLEDGDPRLEAEFVGTQS